MLLYDMALLAVLATALCVAVVLTFIAAPYGRHARTGWGPSLPTRTAWIIMEAPPVLAFSWFFLHGPQPHALAGLLLAGLWLTHYVDRDLLYPLRLRVRPGDRTPILIVGLGVVFNSINGYLNGSAAAGAEGLYPVHWLVDARFICGGLVFAAGFVINRWADAGLRRLRAQAEDYAIPRGGLYRWISCPNYFGEMLQWFGWALASWSLAGLTFAIFTVANLLPRAWAHHRWYRKTFPDYPAKRRAILPGIL